MASQFENFLARWDKSYIRAQDLYPLFPGHHSTRYDAVKYALKKGMLRKVYRGLYLIDLPYRPVRYDPFELANIILGPSYISLESALSHHQWIPERVYSITSVTPKRKKQYSSDIAVFNYEHVGIEHFYNNVMRVETDDSVFFMAEPWKALADFLHVYNREYQTLVALENDLRIDREVVEEADLASLKEIIGYYPNKKVCKTLTKFLKELET